MSETAPDPEFPEATTLEDAQEAIEAKKAPNNAANPTAVQTKRKRGTDRQRRELNAMASLLANADGRLLLRTVLFNVCGLNADIASAAYDENSLHYRAGARRVGLELQNRAIAADKAAYITMISEEVNGEGE